MNVMTRQQAKEAGLTRYFTGKPCKHGHIAERRMSDGCVVCAEQHSRKWQAEHPESVKAKGRRYHAENRELRKQKYLAWREANPQKQAAATKAWRERNMGQVRATKAQWRKANASDVNAAQNRRHADKLKRTPLWADHQAICVIYRAARIAKTTWPELDPEVDHVVPLRGKTVSGLHVHHNLQIITGTANRVKSTHF